MRTDYLRRTLASILSGAAVAVLLAVLAPELAEAGSIHVALSPRDTVVTPGADFWVSIDVTTATAGYTGWLAVIKYDPAALTYLPTSPTSGQQGCLMAGTCSDALGNTACGANYIEVTPAADSIEVLDALLCSSVFLYAPGRLFRLHFRAANTVQPTVVHIERIIMATAPPFQPGIVSADAVIGIGHNLAGVEPGTGASGLRVRLAPNPTRGAVTLSLEADRSGEQLIAVHDLQGRLVRTLSRGWQPAAKRQLVWDGLTDAGERAIPGVYMVLVRVAGRQSLQRVTLLD